MARTVTDIWPSHFLVNFDDNESGFGSHAVRSTFEQACALASEHERPNRIPKIRQVRCVSWSSPEPAEFDHFTQRYFNRTLTTPWFWVMWNGEPRLIVFRQRYFHDALRKTAGASKTDPWHRCYWDAVSDPAAIRWTDPDLGMQLTALLGSRRLASVDTFAGTSPAST